jgi:hypothetical protein
MFPAVGTFKLLIGEYLPDNEKWWMSALDPPKSVSPTSRGWSKILDALKWF